MNKLQYNEKPSSINNIGQDIQGARRHDFNTYTDEQKEKKEREKKKKNNKNELKEEYKVKLSRCNDSAEMIEVITEYEKRALCLKLDIDPSMTIDDVRTAARKSLDGSSAYRRFYNLIRRVSWRLNDEKLRDYFGKRKIKKYQHVTGVKRQWITEEKLSETALDFFKSEVMGIQFGNSIPDIERTFNLNELEKGVRALQSLISFDFKRVGFSFGARGKAGSVAHYEDATKVIAINRHRCGSIIHEIGHALDYQKGMLSNDLPESLIDRYRKKVISNPALNANRGYLMNRKEIFARAFERLMSGLIINPYMIDGSDHDYPDLNDDDIQWMKERVLK